MVKLKDLLNESAPGFENRQFGDPLPKLADITKKYQEKNGINEVSLPSEVKRYMEKFTSALKNAGLNRQKQLLVLAGIVDSLGVEPNQLMALIQKVKKGMNAESIDEAISKEKVDVKKVAANMRKDKSGFFGNSWAKAIMKKYPNGVSENDLQMDLPDYIAGSAITNLFK